MRRKNITLYLCCIFLVFFMISIIVSNKFFYLPIYSIPTETKANAQLLPTYTPIEISQLQIDSIGKFGKNAANDIAWSFDGKYFVVNRFDIVDLYNTETWQIIKSISTKHIKNNQEASISFDPINGDLVFIGNQLSTQIWRFEIQNIQNILSSLWIDDPELASFSDLLISPNGELFALINTNICENVNNDNMKCSSALELHNTDDGKLLYRLQDFYYADDKEITTFKFNPNNKQIATGSENNVVVIWDTLSGKKLFEFQHESKITDLEYSPDGSVLVSASNDATIRFWDTLTGKQLFTLVGFTNGIRSINIFDNGNKLLIGLKGSNTFQQYALNEQYLPFKPLNVTLDFGKNAEIDKVKILQNSSEMTILYDGIVQLWNLDNGKLVRTLPEYNGGSGEAAISPDSKMMAVSNTNIHIWNLSEKKWTTVLPLHASQTNFVLFSPDGDRLAVSADQEISIWNTITYQKDLWIDLNFSAENLVFSPDGNIIAVAGYRNITLLDTKSGDVIQELTSANFYPIAMSFSENGEYFFFVGENERTAWNLADGKPLYSIPNEVSNNGSAGLTSTLGFINQSSFIPPDNPDGYGQLMDTISYFDPMTGEIIYSIQYEDVNSHSSGYLNPTGTLMLLQKDGWMSFVDTSSGKELTSLSSMNRDYKFSPDSSMISFPDFETNTTEILSVSGFSSLKRNIITGTSTVIPTKQIVSSPTPTALPSIGISNYEIHPLSGNAIKPENLPELRKQFELGIARSNTGALSSNGQILAVGDSSGISVYPFGSSIPNHVFPSDASIPGLTFSPNGKYLAVQSYHLNTKVWNIQTGELIFTSADEDCLYQEISFSSDSKALNINCGEYSNEWDFLNEQLLDTKKGKFLDSGSGPSENWILSTNPSYVQLIDANSKEIFKTFDVPKYDPVNAIFSPNGKYIVIWFFQFALTYDGYHFPGEGLESKIQIWEILPDHSLILTKTINGGKFFKNIDYRSGPRSLGITPDSQRLITASGDGFSRIWNLPDGKLLYTFSEIQEFYISSDGNSLFSSRNPEKVWDISPDQQPTVIWDRSNLTKTQTFTTIINNPPTFITADNDSFYFWKLDGFQVAEQPDILKTKDNEIYFPSISPDGKFLAYLTTEKLVLGENNSQNPNWRILQTFHSKPNLFSSYSIEFSPDSSILAVLDVDQRLWLWRLYNLDEQPIELTPSNIFLSNILFTPDSQYLLGLPFTSGNEKDPVDLWNARTGELLRTWEASCERYALHPEGRILAISNYDDNQIRFIDIDSWSTVQTMDFIFTNFEYQISFSPDGNLFVIKNGENILFYEYDTGKLVRTIDGNFNDFSFSPDGDMLITSLKDGRIQFWGIEK